MSTYVMSDIHGCYDEFQKMLSIINFNDNDQLILAGDYIDRGDKSYEMLRWLENAPENVLLIKGNHDVELSHCLNMIISIIKRYNINTDKMDGSELLKIYHFIKEQINGDIFDYYGTLKQIFSTNEIFYRDIQMWRDIIDNMPYYFKTTIEGEKYIIVHAGYISSQYYNVAKHDYENIESFYIYSRGDYIGRDGINNLNIVFGHTPTIAKGLFYNNGKICKKYNSYNKCTYYNIDCGISYKSNVRSHANLACLRLEDKKMYYTE